MSKRLLLLISVYGALPIALVLFLFVGWRLALERSTLILQSADSPDGRYRAEVVREDPGASSSYEYMVRVTQASQSQFASILRSLPLGLRYTALDAHHEPDKLTAQWTGPDQLTIYCEGCNGATVGSAQWRDIQFRFDLR